MSNDGKGAGYFDFRQSYYTAEQAEALYDILLNDDFEIILENYYVQQGAEYCFAQGAQYLMGVISIIDSTGALKEIPFSSEIVMMLQYVVDMWCDSIVNNNSTEKEDVLKFIHDRCGWSTEVEYVIGENGRRIRHRIYHCTSGLTYRTEKGREIRLIGLGWCWYSDVKTRTVNFETYNSNEMYGAPFIHGCWWIDETQDLGYDDEYKLIN